MAFDPRSFPTDPPRPEDQPTQPHSTGDDIPTQVYPLPAHPGKSSYPNYPSISYAPTDDFATRAILPPAPQSIEQAQAVRISRRGLKRRSPWLRSCLSIGCLGVLALLALLAAYFLAPLRTNILLLGIDRPRDGASPESAIGRSDTMILVSVVPLKPEVHMLSIPRDLWVNVPGVGEQRINTANFFAEAKQPGSGPEAAVQTVEQNFGVQIPYYVRVRFDSFPRIIDALGGLTVDLPEDMSGYSAGTHHLNAEQALAFVRDRKGSDDFFRMGRAQIVIRALMKQSLDPATWLRLPDVVQAVGQTVDSNIPLWQFPRLGLALLRAQYTGIDSRTIDREMVTPFTTDGGADVLLPNWDAIRPVINQMFAP